MQGRAPSPNSKISSTPSPPTGRPGEGFDEECDVKDSDGACVSPSGIADPTVGIVLSIEYDAHFRGAEDNWRQGWYARLIQICQWTLMVSTVSRATAF